MTSPAQEMWCPECGGPLRTLDRPCSNCGLIFIRGRKQCPTCHEPFGTHTLQCRPEARLKAGPILCPLCGMKRHRKDAKVSREICLWRQWAVEARLANKDDPSDAGPDRNAETQAKFDRWLAAHPYIEGGSVPAERYLRQRMRQAQPGERIDEFVDQSVTVQPGHAARVRRFNKKFQRIGRTEIDE